MQCPKCGSSQPVTNKECPSCGIIFDRWQPRAPRRTTSSSTPVPPPPPQSAALETAQPRIPNSVVAIGLVVVVIIGLMWTQHVRNSRPKSNGLDDTINQINNSGLKTRSDLMNRKNPGGNVVRASSAASGLKLPGGLDEDTIRTVIEQCSFFQNEVNVDIPKTVDARSVSLGLSGANALAAAANDHLIEFDPPMDSNLPYGVPVSVKVTQYASAKVTVMDNGNSYRFGLGRRHVKITSVRPGTNGATVAFTWSLDSPDVMNLVNEGTNPSGGADIGKGLNGWIVTRAWQQSAGQTRYLCQ